MLQQDLPFVAVNTPETVPQLAHRQNSMMLFELSVNGHHAVYIRHLVRYWCEQGLQGQLHIVVAPEFMQKCADIVAIAQQHPTDNIAIRAITTAEFSSLNTDRSTFIKRQRRAWQEWSLISAYAKKLTVDHCFLDSFDFFQWAFLFSQPLPCPLSGIYFKPTFHYSTFAHHTTTFKSYLQRWRETLSLRAIFRHPSLQQLMCLDPFAVEALNNSFAKGKAVTLADPVSRYPAQPLSTDLKAQLNIEDGRRIFLLFGDLTARKGVTQLLEAIALLPNSTHQKICILLVGRCNLENQQKFEARIEQLRQQHPIQLIEHYEFVSEQQVQAYFQLTDVVLAPYQRHVGMSGILLQAAAAKKPVLSSNYGLMGELVSRYQLGLAVESTQPAEIAKALQQLVQAPLDQVYDQACMEAFCEQNTVEKFASTIFSGFKHRHD